LHIRFGVEEYMVAGIYLTAARHGWIYGIIKSETLNFIAVCLGEVEVALQER
jgi:hypothetical protein